MNRIDIKPLSTNEAWKGKRFKSDKYKRHERALGYLLPKLEVPKEGELRIDLVFGYGSAGSDWDNSIKQTQDIICKKYKFNDNRIYVGHVEKRVVGKGNEFIEFDIYQKPDLTQADLELIRLINKHGSEKALELFNLKS